jgi:hypothetical protein
MADLDELDLEKSTGESHVDEATPREGPPRDFHWIAIAAGLLLLAIAIGYFVLRRQAQPEPQRPAARAAVPPSEPAPALRPEPGENIFLPPLDQTDALVRQLVTRLSAHPKVAAWLATEQLIRNFTVVTMNIAGGETPSVHLRAVAPADAFRVRESQGAVFIDPASYARYNDYAAAIGALDARGCARLYATLKPRIADAAKDLGQPGDFDPVLEKAIAELLAVPIVDGDVALTRKTLTYGYADPRLEGLSKAQRQLLRMGPGNVKVVQAKLREIALYLGIPPDRLPPAPPAVATR